MHHDEVLGESSRLFVSKSCAWFRKEISAYRYRPHRSIADEFVDEPMKEEDHVLDAARYAIHSHFTRPRVVRDLRNLPPQ